MKYYKLTLTFLFACLLHALILPLQAVTMEDFEARIYDPDDDPNTDNLHNRLFIPKDYDTNKSYPLVIHLHGLGSGNGNNITQMADHGHGGMYFAEDDQQAYEPSFVLIPQEPVGSTHWHQQPVKGLLIGLIDSVLSEYSNIDPDRVYLGGISMGGNGTWSHLVQQPNKFAAAYILAGAGGTGSASSIDHVPMWFLHGNADTTVSYSTSVNRVNTLRGLGAPVIFTTFDNVGHAIGPRSGSIYDLYVWLMSQRRGQVAQGAPLLRITEYSVDSNLDISGVALDDLAQVDDVDWSNSAGGSGTATGTSSWSASNITLSGGTNLVTVTATGWSYDESNTSGFTTFSQALQILGFSAPSGDVTAPVMVTTSPSHTGFSVTTATTPLSFTGTASDDTGVSSVTWATDRGYSGTASGTTSWSASIALELDVNTVEITAMDANGNLHAQVFEVNYTGTVVNEAPEVRTGPDLLLAMPYNTADLDAAVGDDGLPLAFSVEWTKESGPGTVTFGDAYEIDTTATFSTPGTYVLRLTADDSSLTGYDEVTVIVRGTPVAISGPGVLGINCRGTSSYTASDGTVYYPDDTYAELLGGGSHTSSAAIADTTDDTIYQTGYFPRGDVLWRNIPLSNGEYVVTLKMVNPNNAVGKRLGDYYIEGMRVLNDFDVRAYVAKDTALDRSFAVTITDGDLDVILFEANDKPLLCGILVQQADTGSPTNTAPTVDAGADQSVLLANGASLDGTVTDDGLAPGNPTPTTTWSKDSGPGTVTFGSASAVDTTADFSVDGTYVLRLTADDGDLSSYDTVTITVTDQSAPTASRTVVYDFGGQSVPSGNWNLVRYYGVNDNVYDAVDTDGNSTPFDLVINDDFKGRDYNGFTGLSNYPDEATFDAFYTNLTNPAEIAFQGLIPAANYSVTIFASIENTGSPGDYVGKYTIDSVDETLDAENNTAQVVTFGSVTPDSGGEIVLSMVSNTGSGIALVNVIELTELAANEAPVVDAGSDASVNLSTGASLDGTVTDDGNAPGSATPTTTWSKVSGPGTVTFGDANAVDTTATFSAAGEYVLQLYATDGDMSDSDTVTITVIDDSTPVLQKRLYFDFGGQVTPSANWNLVRYYGVNDGVTDAVDTNGNATSIDLRITDDFKGRNLTGVTGEAPYDDDAAYDSFYTNLGNLAEFDLEDLDTNATYTVTIVASADEAWSGEFTIGGTLVTDGAAADEIATITVSDVVPTQSGTITIEFHAENDTGSIFINILDLAEYTTGS